MSSVLGVTASYSYPKCLHLPELPPQKTERKPQVANLKSFGAQDYTEGRQTGDILVLMSAAVTPDSHKPKRGSETFSLSDMLSFCLEEFPKIYTQASSLSFLFVCNSPPAASVSLKGC